MLRWPLDYGRTTFGYTYNLLHYGRWSWPTARNKAERNKTNGRKKELRNEILWQFAQDPAYACRRSVSVARETKNKHPQPFIRSPLPTAKLKTKYRINRGLFKSLRFIRFEWNDECIEGTVFHAARLSATIAQLNTHLALFLLARRAVPICCNFCFWFTPKLLDKKECLASRMVMGSHRSFFDSKFWTQKRKKPNERAKNEKNRKSHMNLRSRTDNVRTSRRIEKLIWWTIASHKPLLPRIISYSQTISLLCVFSFLSLFSELNTIGVNGQLFSHISFPFIFRLTFFYFFRRRPNWLFDVRCALQ